MRRTEEKSEGESWHERRKPKGNREQMMLLRTCMYVGSTAHHSTITVPLVAYHTFHIRVWVGSVLLRTMLLQFKQKLGSTRAR